MTNNEKPPPLWLAPMDGVTDYPFRLWMQLLRAPDYATTPFLRVTPGLNWQKNYLLFVPECFDLKGLFPTTVVPQLMGSSADDIANVAQGFLPHCESVDLNCGCPAPIVFKHGAGSALLKSPEAFSIFLERIFSKIPKDKLSVKMRTGVTGHDEFPGLLAVVSELSPRRLFLHPRTRQQGYSGVADWSQVAYATHSTATPIVGSGDIVDSSSLGEKLAAAPRVSGVMIGRGALANPWIFAELKGELSVKPDSRAVAWAIAALLLCHHTTIVASQSEVRAFSEAVATLGPCYGARERLEAAVHRLAELALPHHHGTIAALALSPHALPRTKQLVKFLSPSFIEADLRGRLLRASTVNQFLTELLTESCHPLT
jgi:tRNA-dihydrouridine synthase